MDELSGSVERVTYYNSENGYTVLRLRPEKTPLAGMQRDGLVTVTGNLPELTPGELVKVTGNWLNHPRHGMQFQVETCEKIMPATAAGMIRYLGSGLIRGIGPRLAERIVERFGLETLEVIERCPERLLEVPDIGSKRSRQISMAWQEQKQIKEVMLFLHAHGVSTNLAIKIYKQYGERALQVVQEDPYQLARDIYGVGFKTADRLAQALGLPKDHPSRIEAGVVYSLNDFTMEGHVFVPRQELIAAAADLLETSEETVQSAVDRLEENRLIQLDQVPFEPAQGDKPAKRAAPAKALPAVEESRAAYGRAAVYLAGMFHSEKGTANQLQRLAAAWPTRLSDLPPLFINFRQELSAAQQAAVRSALSHPVSVLTGGPGTGKTTALRALIDCLEEANKTYALASPTGRAAKRLSQATGRPASTIHRLLGFSPGEGFKFNAEKPLDIDMLVIDEASMLDLVLAYHLFKAVKEGTHLLLVGDVDQLPSVGAGDVLRDVIASQVAPVACLKEIFRQAAGSSIVANAHRINQGLAPVFDASPDEIRAGVRSDFFFFPADSPDSAAAWVEEVVCRRIPARFSYHPSHDIQVLSPMYRGPAGVTSLNERLQAALNPPHVMKPERRLFGQLLRKGDKVMQTQNNYEKDVFNGDVGILTALDMEDHTLTVVFDGRSVVYDWMEADQLALAYAISVHKAQGSEFPAVVIPLLTQHYMMLQRNLLYTAVTRARDLCVVVGSQRAVHIAVHNDKITRRYTALDWRLRHEM